MVTNASSGEAFLGCSAQPEGVDDDQIGVALNYTCSFVLLCFAFALWRRHGYRRARSGIVCELGMALGYFTGGLVHGAFANRASDDDCASSMFYPVFSISYLGMLASAAAWTAVAQVSWWR